METRELEYDLPEGLIAQAPARQRRESRLLVLDRATGAMAHRRFASLGEWLRAGDCLVLNESKVLPAKFRMRRRTGGQVEGLFLRLTEEGYWEALLRKASRLKEGEVLSLEGRGVEAEGGAVKDSCEGVRMRVVRRVEKGTWWLACEGGGGHVAVLEEYGWTPLPPYIRRKAVDAAQDAVDRERYQTVYASREGSVAAPTAGLHFDEALLAELRGKGVLAARVSLHVGLGTFESVAAERVEDHAMHSEYYRVEASEAACINEARARGGRVVAVGTTAVRVLETVGCAGQVAAGSGWTRLLIVPPYEFKVVDALVTNFHLPRTTLLALVCALGGGEHVLAAYREAVRLQYRFYSYGDAMLVI